MQLILRENLLFSNCLCPDSRFILLAEARPHAFLSHLVIIREVYLGLTLPHSSIGFNVSVALCLWKDVQAAPPATIRLTVRVLVSAVTLLNLFTGEQNEWTGSQEMMADALHSATCYQYFFPLCKQSLFYKQRSRCDTLSSPLFHFSQRVSRYRKHQYDASPFYSPSLSHSPTRCRFAAPTTRRTLLCRNSSSRCATRWPTWRGECSPPPCCSTAAGWAQSTLWYSSFKSRSPLLPQPSSQCLRGGTNPLASLCASGRIFFVVESQYCKLSILSFMNWKRVLFSLSFHLSRMIFFIKKRKATPFWLDSF